MLKISAFYLEKQKRFVPKKSAPMLVIETLKCKISDFLNSNTCFCSRLYSICFFTLEQLTISYHTRFFDFCPKDLKYRIVASRSTCYYSGNQKFCILGSRLLTCCIFFFLLQYQNRFGKIPKNIDLAEKILRLHMTFWYFTTYSKFSLLKSVPLKRIVALQMFLRISRWKTMVQICIEPHFKAFCMMNLQYEMRICQNKYNTSTMANTST